MKTLLHSQSEEKKYFTSVAFHDNLAPIVFIDIEQKVFVLLLTKRTLKLHQIKLIEA